MFIVFLRRLCVHVIMKLPDGTVVTADGGVVLMSDTTGYIILTILGVFALILILGIRISLDLALFD